MFSSKSDKDSLQRIFNWFTAHRVWTVRKPHNVIQVDTCVPSFVLCPRACTFKFIKGMSHSTSSNACVAECLIAVVLTFIKGVHHSTSGDMIDVHIRAFLCSSKVYVTAQEVTRVTHMSLELNKIDEQVDRYCLCLRHTFWWKLKGKRKC